MTVEVVREGERRSSFWDFVFYLEFAILGVLLLTMPAILISGRRYFTIAEKLLIIPLGILVCSLIIENGYRHSRSSFFAVRFFFAMEILGTFIVLFLYNAVQYTCGYSERVLPASWLVIGLMVLQYITYELGIRDRRKPKEAKTSTKPPEKYNRKNDIAALAVIILFLSASVGMVCITLTPPDEPPHPPFMVPIGTTELDGNTTHWMIGIVSNDAEFNGTESRLQKEGITVPGYDLLTRNDSTAAMNWHDTNGDCLISPGDTISIEKPSTTPGEYVFVTINEYSYIIEKALTV